MIRIGVKRCFNNTSENFTTDIGMKIRRRINKPFRKLLKLATKRKVVVESYPNLPKNKPFIFASTHSYDEDMITGISTIDRSAYMLCGSTHQMEINPLTNILWVSGICYVNRLSKESRRDSIKKMERVLQGGTSILIYPEGGWNNSENLLVQKLFPGVYTVSRSTGVPVVPISNYHDFNSDIIHIKVGEPLELFKYDDSEYALNELRNAMATMMYEQIEKYSRPLQRQNLSGDIHLQYMEERRQEYMRVHWKRDCWEEELTVRKDRNNPSPNDVRSFVDSININEKNAAVLAPILALRSEDLRYDFKRYMHANWNKK